MADHKLLRDIKGSVLVESTIVIPMFLVLVLGTIDVTYMFYDWALANKAAYVGARTAAVSNPVAPGMTDLRSLYNATDLQQQAGGSCYGSTVCPSANATCTSTTCTTTTLGFTPGFDSTAFTNNNKTGIFDSMQAIFPRLQPQNVTIFYETNGSGIVGQTWSGSPDLGNPQLSLPMNVKVSITGMTHQFYFISPLLSFFGGAISAAPAIPTFATTMQSEDMFTL